MDSASVPDRRARGGLGFWRRPWAASLLLAVLASVVFLFRLGSPPLTSPNEGLYAEVAREMNATGDFVIPRANTVVYLEKPPLLYWGTALSMRVFGENAFAARLPSALAAIATVLLVGAAGRRLFGARAGILSGIVLATSLGFALVGRQVLFDSLLTLWTTLALLGFWFGTEPANDPRSRRRWLLAGYAALGLGVLTKGLVSIAIPALVAIVYALAARDGARVRRAWSGSGAVLFLAVAVPWHVIASLRQKQFAWFYLVNEHWLRFLGRREPADFHADPIFAPAAAVFLLPLPWSIFLPAAFASELRSRRAPREILFLFSWILAPVVFFTLSRTRTYYYLLPAVPAVALWLGRFWSKLSERDEGTQSKWLLWTAIFAGLVAWDLWILAGAGFGSTLREAAMAQIWFASGLWLVDRLRRSPLVSSSSDGRRRPLRQSGRASSLPSWRRRDSSPPGEPGFSTPKRTRPIWSGNGRPRARASPSKGSSRTTLPSGFICRAGSSPCSSWTLSARETWRSARASWRTRNRSSSRPIR